MFCKIHKSQIINQKNLSIWKNPWAKRECKTPATPDCPKPYKICETIQERQCEPCPFQNWKPKPRECPPPIVEVKHEKPQTCNAGMGKPKKKCHPDMNCDNKTVPVIKKELPKSDWEHFGSR